SRFPVQLEPALPAWLVRRQRLVVAPAGGRDHGEDGERESDQRETASQVAHGGQPPGIYPTAGAPGRRGGLSAGPVGPGVARGRPLDGLGIDPRGLTLVEAQLCGEEAARFPLGLLVGGHEAEDIALPAAVAEE